MMSSSYKKPAGVSSAGSFEDSGLPESYREAWDAYPQFEYKRGWLDKLGGALGMRTGYDSAYETWLNGQQSYRAELLNQAREEDYNSPEAASARERAAGLNPDISGQTSATNEASENSDIVTEGFPETRINTDFSGLADIVGFFQTAVGIASGFESIKGIRADNISKDVGIVDKLFNLGLSNTKELFRPEEHPNEVFRKGENGKYGWYTVDGVLTEELEESSVSDDFLRTLGLPSSVVRRFGSAYKTGRTAALSGLPSLVERASSQNQLTEQNIKGSSFDILGFTGANAHDAINDIASMELRVYKARQQYENAMFNYKMNYFNSRNGSQQAQTENTQDILSGQYASESISQGLPASEVSSRKSSYDEQQVLSNYRNSLMKIRSDMQHAADNAPGFLKYLYMKSLDNLDGILNTIPNLTSHGVQGIMDDAISSPAPVRRIGF